MVSRASAGKTHTLGMIQTLRAGIPEGSKASLVWYLMPAVGLGLRAGDTEQAVGQNVTCGLRVASWASAQYSVWVSRMSLPREPGKTLSLFLPQLFKPHNAFSLLVPNPPRFKAECRFYLLMGRVSRSNCKKGMGSRAVVAAILGKCNLPNIQQSTPNLLASSYSDQRPLLATCLGSF